MARMSVAGANAACAGMTSTMNNVSLHTADPGTDGANEVSGGTYGRVGATWAAPSGGLVANSNTAAVNVPAGVTITHFGLWSTGGVYQIGGALNVSQNFASAGTYTLPPGTLNVDPS